MTTSTLSTPTLPQTTGEELIEPSWETQRHARTLLLTLPAPRGQIVDRNGLPLAQTRVAQNLALNFPTPLTMSDSEATQFARQNLEVAKTLFPGRQFAQTDEFLLRFYQHRGMLPLILAEDLRADEIELVKGRLPPGLRLLPSYVRYYPNGALAGHVVGYCSKTGGVPDRPVQNNDTIWPDFEGREGLEQTFNAQLTGRPGQLNIVMDRTGAKVTERVSIPPQPGANVVTSLDRDLQALCESVLEKRAKRGALVFIQPSTGDILALASWPRIDPNVFTPSISPEVYRLLEEDPDVPLLPRAYRSAYPPGSTFKVFVGIAALESGAVDPSTTIDCPASITVGRTIFRNWKKSGAGYLTLRGALEQSCNTWFYQAGIKMGAAPIIEYAQRLGLGRRTGIPLR
ncbi:MAG: penicillin-binding transpeptidase domain-containing protein, partial [Verrucomicrobiia bacterium]